MGFCLPRPGPVRAMGAKVNFVGGIDFAVLDLGHHRGEGRKSLQMFDQQARSGRQGRVRFPAFLAFHMPDDLKRGIGLPCARGHDREQAVASHGDSLQNSVDTSLWWWQGSSVGIKIGKGLEAGDSSSSSLIFRCFCGVSEFRREKGGPGGSSHSISSPAAGTVGM